MSRRRFFGEEVHVTNNSDDINVVGSLRWAIAQANEPSSVIRFADILDDIAGTGDEIQLTKPQSELVESGYAQLYFPHATTLVGNGHTNVRNMTANTRTIYCEVRSSCYFHDMLFKDVMFNDMGYGSFSHQADFRNCRFVNIKRNGYAKNIAYYGSAQGCCFEDCDVWHYFFYGRSEHCYNNVFIRCAAQLGTFGAKNSYFEDMAPNVGRYLTQMDNCTFNNTGTTARNVEYCTKYVNCNFINHSIKSSVGFQLHGCTALFTKNFTMPLSNDAVELYNCLLVKGAEKIFTEGQIFVGSGNIHLSTDMIDETISTKYAGSVDDLIDSTIQDGEVGIKYFKPRGAAIGFCENLKNEIWKLTDIRSYARGNPTDCGALATEAILI